jgi:DNA-binding transcriptional ArsR family regulator
MRRLAALVALLLVTAAVAPVAAGAAGATGATVPTADAGEDPDRTALRVALASVVDPEPTVRAAAVSVSPVVTPAVALLVAVGDAVSPDPPRRAGDGRDRLPPLLVPIVVGYVRPDEGDPLAHDTRAALVEAVRESPGAPLASVGRAVGVPRSTARYHVDVLEREGYVVAEQVAGRNRLFPAEAESRALAAALQRAGAGDLLRSLATDGPASVTELADRIDRSPATVSHHLSGLADDGLVDRRADGRRRIAHLAGPARDLATPDPPFAADD